MKYFTQRFMVLLLLVLLAQITHAQCEKLVWQDEFNGATLDLNKWGHETGDGCPNLCQWGTGQLDYSTDRPENVLVENGYLHLTVRKEDDPSQFNNREYTSGRIRTYQKVDFRYGRIEARLKGVRSQGFGFAFWMLGSDFETTSWPKCGEIDIFEQTGRSPNYNIGTTHFQDSWGHSWNQGNITLPEGEYFDDEFHVMGLIWTPDSMSWYMDTPDNIYHTFHYSEPINDYDPFNRDFFIILSVGMGGDYSGEPDATTLDAQTAVIDYVRVYKGDYAVEIKGDPVVYEQTESSYSITSVENASYEWNVPNGATIVSGQGTENINVKWGDPTSAGAISCTVSGCTVRTYTHNVEIEETIVVDNLFDDLEGNHKVIYADTYSGSLDTLAANPAPNSVNSSAVVARHGRDAGTEWDYVVLNGFEPGHAGEFVQGTKRLFLDVYTDAPVGSKITLGFENSSVATPEAVWGKHSNYEAYTTTQNGWETLEFKLTGVPDKYTGSYNVDKAVFLFEPGLVSDHTFYFDNFRSGIPGGEPPVLSADVLEDWDGTSKIGFLAATGTYEANASNPSASGVNASASVLKYTRNAGTEYDEISYKVAFDDASVFKEGKSTISFDLYTAVPVGTIISMHLVDSTQSTDNWEYPIHSIYEARTTKTNDWETITFKWSSTPNAAVPNVNVNKLIFKIDEKQFSGDAYYIDNIKVSSTDQPAQPVLSAIIEDYEVNRHLQYVWSGDPYEAPVENPEKSDANNSDFVASYGRGYNSDDWLVFNLDTVIDAAKLREKEKVFALDVKTNAPVGSLITLGLEAGTLATSDNWPTGRHSDYASATKAQDEWHTIKFIYSSSSDGSTPAHLVDKLIITANQGSTELYDFYFDNLRIMELVKDTVLTSIEITPSLLENISVGEVIDFNAAGFDQFGAAFPADFTWTVDGGGTIDAATGVFTVTENGVWKVTASSGSVRSVANVLVGEGIQLSRISLSPATVTIYETETLQLNARGYDQLNRAFAMTAPVWSVDETSVATIDQNGLLTSLKPGTVVVSCTENGVTTTAEITVRAAKVLNSISISPETPSIFLDETKQFAAVTLDQYGNAFETTVNWSATGGNINEGLFAPSVRGTYNVVAQAGDFSASTYITVKERPVNLALNKLATVSSSQAGLDPVDLTDGDKTTVWGTEWSDTEWFTIDLGDNYDLTSMLITWEAAYSAQYELLVSADGSNWTSVYTESNGNGGTDNIAVSATARYVKWQGIARGTDWGNAFYEFEVYGLPHEAVTLTSVVVSPYNSSIDKGETQQFTATAFDQFGNEMNVNFAWSATNGTIDAAGLYTANTGGTHTISASAEGVSANATITVIETVTPCGFISEGKTATSSSAEGDMSAANAFDSNRGTRWASEWNDNEWITIDLEGQYTICSVELDWEAASGKAYEIQLSNDETFATYEVIAAVSNGTGGNEVLSTDNSKTGRYLRLQGIERNTGYGYSLFEMRVFGSSAGSVIAPVAAIESVNAITLPTNSVVLTGSATDADGEIISYEWTKVEAAGTIVTPNAATTIIENLTAGDHTFMLTVTDNDGLTDSETVTVTVLEATGECNLISEGKTATQSTYEGDMSATYAVDGNMGTRWSSEWNDPQWIVVDLGAEFSICSVEIEWETASGKVYEIQLSNDETFATYDVIASESNGDGGFDQLTTDTSKTGRYIRLYGTERNTGYGYSIWEFRVYGSAAVAQKSYRVGSISNERNFDIRMYPNPVIDYMQVEISNSDSDLHLLKVTDLTGKVMLQQQIEDNSAVDLSALQSGTYFVILQTNKQRTSRMIIKQ